MNDADCVEFLQWCLPRLNMRWPGFRKVRKQVCKRIHRRITQLNLDGLTSYRDYLASHQSEWTVLDEFCRISISRFYRDRSVFDLLRAEVLPWLANAAKDGNRDAVRVWSAGCASGEEPYTLRIIWKMDIEPRIPDTKLRIVASDADPNMLRRAQEGCYPASSLKDLPQGWKTNAFQRHDTLFRIRNEFRSDIEFRQHDVRHQLFDGLFDIILCRHMAFTYFDQSMQCDVLQRLLNRLSSHGFFVIGKQESLPLGQTQLEEVAPHSGVYRRAGIS